MAYWEFLLQKEGDRDWLPLETAHVEISEGRYRIIAHTSYCDTRVSIRLSRLLTEAIPPQRKTLKRHAQTNENGLMVVIPFTHLTPGNWTVTCEAIAPASSDAEPWQYGVQLQVLAIESGTEYWDTERDEAAFAEQLTTDPTFSTSTTVRSSSPPPTASEVTATDIAAPSLDAAFAEGAPLADLPLRLQLQHQALVAQTDSPIQLRGQVTSFSQVQGLSGEGTLWIQLRNPETGQVVQQATQALSIAHLPSRFETTLTLPAKLSTRLLVGELSLWTASAPPQILAIQGFTVTLNLDDLLEVVANQAERSPATPFEDVATSADTEVDAAPTEDEDAAASPPAEPSIPIAAPLSPREIPFRLVYLPSTGLTLPPVIYRPIDKKGVGTPSLPALSPDDRDRPPTPPAASASSPTKPLTLPPLGSNAKAGSGTTTSANTTPPPPELGVELPAFGRSRRSSPADSPPPEAPSFNESAPSTNADAAANDAAVDDAVTDANAAFEPDFEGRFWHRLSALAEEAQRAAADYQAQLEAAGVDPSSLTDPGAVTTSPTLPLESGVAVPSTEDDTVNYEVVVYETDDTDAVALTGADAPEADLAPDIEVLQPGEAHNESLGTIPVPEWIFPQGELVAGTPLPITIRLPAYPRRLAVKVWITDIQSRTVVDRPRWLMNWTPAADGTQTAFLQLQVPMGSVEARFEAIAIDLATQQESYKTSLVRSIVPANFIEIDIDDPF